MVGLSFMQNFLQSAKLLQMQTQGACMHACICRDVLLYCMCACAGLHLSSFVLKRDFNDAFNKGLVSPLQLKDTIAAQRLDKAPTELLYAMNEALWVFVRPCEYMQMLFLRVTLHAPNPDLITALLCKSLHRDMRNDSFCPRTVNIIVYVFCTFVMDL